MCLQKSTKEHEQFAVDIEQDRGRRIFSRRGQRQHKHSAERETGDAIDREGKLAILGSEGCSQGFSGRGDDRSQCLGAIARGRLAIAAGQVREQLGELRLIEFDEAFATQTAVDLEPELNWLRFSRRRLLCVNDFERPGSADRLAQRFRERLGKSRRK